MLQPGCYIRLQFSDVTVVLRYHQFLALISILARKPLIRPHEFREAVLKIASKYKELEEITDAW